LQQAIVGCGRVLKRDRFGSRSAKPLLLQEYVMVFLESPVMSVGRPLSWFLNFVLLHSLIFTWQ